MANVTLYVPDKVKERMAEHPEIRWSNALRSLIEEKLDDLEEADRLASKSRLTEEDVRRISSEINAAMGRHARKLLNEISG